MAQLTSTHIYLYCDLLDCLLNNWLAVISALLLLSVKIVLSGLKKQQNKYDVSPNYRNNHTNGIYSDSI